MGNGEVRDAARDLSRVNGHDDPLSTRERILHWDAEWHFDPLGVTFEQKAIGGLVMKQNAMVGFAHGQYLPRGIPKDLDCCAPLEYPFEFALGTPSSRMGDVDGSETAIEAYYRFLNCGLRPGLAAATDSTYAFVPGTLTYRGWIDPIAAGRTVVSRNGHREFVDLSVNATVNLAMRSSSNVPAWWRRM